MSNFKEIDLVNLSPVSPRTDEMLAKRRMEFFSFKVKNKPKKGKKQNQNQKTKSKLIDSIDDLPKLPFSEILINPKFCFWFQNYLKQEFADENLSFFFAVHQWKAINPNNDALISLSAKKIYDEFISPKAEFQVNIDGITRTKIKKKIQDCDFSPVLFDDALEAVLHLMRTAIYPGFVRSPLYIHLWEDDSTSKK